MRLLTDSMFALCVIFSICLSSWNGCHALSFSHHHFAVPSDLTSRQGLRISPPNLHRLSTRVPLSKKSSYSSPFESFGRKSRAASRPTALSNGVIIDVGDNFFTAAFFGIGLFYSLGKAYNRYLLEEVAFEQRKLEARERRLDQDPTVTELDLRREESEGWTSVYGPDAKRRKKTASAQEDGRMEERGRSRIAVMDREDEEEEDDYGMTDDEIVAFESRYGVEYDPYYDEPYEESELPVGKFKEDKSYGDRRYVNGEVFYKDENSSLFYRQGARPRQKKFWDLSS